MLLQTMSEIEVTKEILDDWKELIREDGTINRLAREYDKLRRKNKIQSSNTFLRVNSIKTHKKNNWIIFLSKAPSETKYNGTESINVLSITYYFTNVGLRAFKVIPDKNGRGDYNGLSVFNSHLFTRYVERQNLEVTDPVTMIKEFFSRNGYLLSKEAQNGIIATCSQGLLLGEKQNSGRWFVYKTFINDLQMYPDQTKEEKELINNLQADIKLALNSKQFNEVRHDYFADTLLGIKKTEPNS